MYQLRLPCLDASSQILPLTQIQVFLADGSTPAPLFDLADQPRSNTFVTDLSGIIEFRVATLITLRFRFLRGSADSRRGRSSGYPRGPLEAAIQSGVQFLVIGRRFR